MHKNPTRGSTRPMSRDEPADAQPLRHQAPRSIRAMAIERVREGERPSEVIASYGFHRCTIYGWLKDARERGDDPLAVAMAAAGPAAGADAGNAGELSAAQQRQLFRWLNGKSPLHYGFQDGLWTSRLVCELIARRSGRLPPPAAVAAVLARLGLLPPPPLKAALQGEAAQARWLRTRYPAIARQAKRGKAELYVWRELPGARAAAPIRQQAPGAAPGRQGKRIVVVSDAKGEAFWFTSYAGALTGRKSVELLRRLMYRRARPLHLLLDAEPAHRSLIVGSYTASLGGRLRLHHLPDAGHPAGTQAEADDIHASEYLGRR